MRLPTFHFNVEGACAVSGEAFSDTWHIEVANAPAPCIVYRNHCEDAHIEFRHDNSITLFTCKGDTGYVTTFTNGKQTHQKKFTDWDPIAVKKHLIKILGTDFSHTPTEPNRTPPSWLARSQSALRTVTDILHRKLHR